jgi:hypothetical protein
MAGTFADLSAWASFDRLGYNGEAAAKAGEERWRRRRALASEHGHPVSDSGDCARCKELWEYIR